MRSIVARRTERWQSGPSAMEYVPARAVEEGLRVSTIHPWTIVDQGDGKWRLCHEYSVGDARYSMAAIELAPSLPPVDRYTASPKMIPCTGMQSSTNQNMYTPLSKIRNPACSGTARGAVRPA